MALIDNRERTTVAAVAALTDCNPFVPERIELEKKVLGSAFVPTGVVWFADGDAGQFDPNLSRLHERIEEVATQLHKRLAAGGVATAEELADYRGLVFYLLWLRYEDDWHALIKAGDAGLSMPRPVSFYEKFARDAAHFLSPLHGTQADSAHLFALGFQVRRAFHHIFRKIFGASLPAARLRAVAWQSIFTRNASRYRAGLYDRMADIPTLITGESGTGKELVARAIALSQYIPFDLPSQSFAVDSTAGFSAVNLAALNPTLIESELFGHRRGAFTGAIEDHPGWFERCGRHGAVFLDEIGELDAAIQVKLLRVLQSREFQRIGETEPRRFAGKIIAATHRNLEHEIDAGRFREDLYYRICADLIHMPTLREQLAANPDDLRNLVLIVARRVAGADEGERLADEVQDWVVAHLGPDYPWPGNMRELEQCVRNILIRGEYRPRRGQPGEADGAAELAALLRRGTLSADDVVQRYAALQFAETDNLHETARRLGMNWRTVRKLVAPGEQNGESRDGSSRRRPYISVPNGLEGEPPPANEGAASVPRSFSPTKKGKPPTR
jgi:transcriptional regulator with AAA-type ATPase domain